MKKKKNVYKKHHIVIIAFLTIFSLIMMYPMAWMLMTSFKSNADIQINKTKFFPEKWTIEGYRTAFEKAPIAQWFINSILVVIVVTAAVIITSTLIGYVFAKYEFKGKKVLFVLLLATMMVPPQVTMIPRYLMIMGFALLAIYFFKVDGGLEQMTAVHTDFETILPHLITKYVPVGLAGLLLAGLLSAFMSTFASTVNAAPAYVVNDIYLKYINPRASVRTQIRASYLVSVLVVVISTVMGFFLKDINEIFQWIVGALFGGYIAANVLKWHWWRFNGEGYFWGMTSGVVAAIVMKFTVPDSLVLYFFPVLFGISLVGCIVGTYSAPPTDEETLVNFYIRVRPWGWWKPVAAKAVARYPQVTRNRHFKRDMFNVAIGIVWQCCLTIVPMYLVVRGTGGLIASVLLLVVTTVVLKYTWYRPLCREEKEYDELMKRIGMD